MIRGLGIAVTVGIDVIVGATVLVVLACGVPVRAPPGVVDPAGGLAPDVPDGLATGAKDGARVGRGVLVAVGV